MPFRYIDKMGIELEGGWHNRPAGCGSDGSVSVAGMQTGEMVSRPIAELSDALAWMKEFYPDGTSHTCGMHVHFSFRRPSDYARLMDKPFHDFFKTEMRKFGIERAITNQNFWKRLDGDNTYCQDKWQPELQAKQTMKNAGVRYAHWNFCHKLHGTVECRMLPTLNP